MACEHTKSRHEKWPPSKSLVQQADSNKHMTGKRLVGNCGIAMFHILICMPSSKGKTKLYVNNIFYGPKTPPCQDRNRHGKIQYKKLNKKP